MGLCLYICGAHPPPFTSGPMCINGLDILPSFWGALKTSKLIFWHAWNSFWKLEKKNCFFDPWGHSSNKKSYPNFRVLRIEEPPPPKKKWGWSCFCNLHRVKIRPKKKQISFSLKLLKPEIEFFAWAFSIQMCAQKWEGIKAHRLGRFGKLKFTSRLPQSTSCRNPRDWDAISRIAASGLQQANFEGSYVRNPRARGLRQGSS